MKNITNRTEIWVINADGSGDTALTTTNGRDRDPIWSPDGIGIVFQSERDGNFEIFKMNSNGSSRTCLTNHSSWDGWPSWERDTSQVDIKFVGEGAHFYWVSAKIIEELRSNQ